MKNKRIWTNQNLNLDDWKAELLETYPFLSDGALMQKMYELNNDYLEDERYNLDVELENHKIIAVANLGLWDGKKAGYKEVGDNIADCLYSDLDYLEWYVDSEGDLRLEGSHHDGNNSVLYRAVSEDKYDEVIAELNNLIFEKNCDYDELEKYFKDNSDSLGPYINKAYGWVA